MTDNTTSDHPSIEDTTMTMIDVMAWMKNMREADRKTINALTEKVDSLISTIQMVNSPLDRLTVNTEDLPEIIPEDVPEDFMSLPPRVIGYHKDTGRDIYNHSPEGSMTSAEYFKARKCKMGNVRSLSQSARNLADKYNREIELVQVVREPIKPGQHPEGVQNVVCFPLDLLDEALEASLPSTGPLAKY